jgi:hypothetical protein
MPDTVPNSAARCGTAAEARKQFLRLAKLCAVAALVVLLGACSGEEPQDSAFKAQTDAIDKAEDANKLLEEAAEAQGKAIDAQGR